MNPLTPESATTPPTPMRLRAEDRFTIEYREVADNIRHYSATRSALTSFLMTVGLTLLAYYFIYDGRHIFLPIAGFVVLAAALLVCFEFSYLTERASIHLKALWKWSKNEVTEYPQIGEPKKDYAGIWSEIWSDRMNPALLAVVALITMAFVWGVVNMEARDLHRKLERQTKPETEKNSPP
jgi:drug/metabolite transporter (DMT)-like permease